MRSPFAKITIGCIGKSGSATPARRKLISCPATTGDPVFQTTSHPAPIFATTPDDVVPSAVVAKNCGSEATGGATNLNDLVYVCRRHHHMLEHGWTLTQDPDNTWTFTPPADPNPTRGPP